MDTRQVIFGILAALALYLIYSQIYALVAPKTPPAVATGTESAPTPPPTTATQPASAAVASEPSAAGLSFSAGASDEPVMLGGRLGDDFEAWLTPTGAALQTLRLIEKNAKTGRFVFRANADSRDPVTLLSPVPDGLRNVASYATGSVFIKGLTEKGWPLDDLIWEVRSATPERVEFTTTLASAEGGPLLQIDKTYALVKDKPLIALDIGLINLSARPLEVVLKQDGPVGILREHQQYDMRRLVAAGRVGDRTTLTTQRWQELKSATLKGEPARLFPLQADETLLWTALADKFFAVYTRPMPGADNRSFVAQVTGRLVRPLESNSGGDLWASFTTQPRVVAPGSEGAARFNFEIYPGPKDSDTINRELGAAYVDRNQLAFTLLHTTEGQCWCIPLWLTELMGWLLQSIMSVVRNGGVAIIILVIIVRTLLHPLTVFQQKAMYRTQEGMLRLQPKLEALKAKYADDPTRLNQETMKLYSEEGVNPLGMMTGMLPILIQMPILGALWTALNTDIYLRHAPLDGWWIRDLSAPDQLIPFNPPIDIPVLSWLPLVGWYFTGVTAFNLLPILMGVSMWLQQKYMPKPFMAKKLEEARKQVAAGAGATRSGMTPEDQMRQQQMMANMMSIMMPFMFYYMPAGLNLYWMATNVFGIGESIIVQRQLKRESERREREGPVVKPKGKPGMIGTWLKKLAEQAESVQKQADAISETNQGPARRNRPGRRP